MEKQHGYEQHKTKAGKAWHFLAHEDTWLSFLVDAILIVVIGKFLIFPALGFAFDTNFPLVAVVSSSMDHHGADFEDYWDDNGQWYLNHNITKEDFLGFYKSNGFKKGDVFVVHGVKQEEIKIGDILVYILPGRPDPIIHRVIEIHKDGTFATKGDGNTDQFTAEKSIAYSQVQGKAVAWAPYIGWVKVAFVEFLNLFR